MTVYERLLVFYRKNPVVRRLDHLQKSLLGARVAKCWYFNKSHKQYVDMITRVSSAEDDGKFGVLSYPEYFAPEIDRLIQETYDKIRQSSRRKRKRIPIKK